MANTFFLVFLATILITRIFLYFKPVASPTIKGFHLHHYMYGIIIALLGVCIQSIVIFAIGLGLFIDEVPYLLLRGKTHADNYSKKSLLGILILIVFVFILKNLFVKSIF